MELENIKQAVSRIEAKLDKVDVKLDNYLERIAKVEVSCDSNKGWIKIMLTALLGGLTTISILVVRALMG